MNDSEPLTQQTKTVGSGYDVPDHFLKQGFGYGSGDIFVVGSARTAFRLAEMAIFFCTVRKEDGKNPFQSVVLIRPPQAFSRLAISELMIAVEDTVLRWSGEAMSNQDKSAFKRRLQFVECPTLELKDLAAIILDKAEKSAVIIEDAALYREDQNIVDLAANPNMLEDVWVPHFHSVCNFLLDIAKNNQLFLVIDAGVEWPHKPKHQDLLLSIDDLGVVSGRVEGDHNAFISKHIEHWFELVDSGNIGQAIAELDGLPAVFDKHKPMVILQLSYRAKLWPLVVEILRKESDSFSNLHSTSAVRIAEIAHAANVDDVAKHLLSNFSPYELPREQIETAAKICENIGLQEASEQCIQVLEETYPASPYLWDRNTRVLFDARRYRELAKLLSGGLAPDHKPLSQMYTLIADEMELEKPNHLSLLKTITKELPELENRAKRALAIDAMANSALATGLLLVQPTASDNGLDPSTVSFMLDALEMVVLTRNDNGEFDADIELVRESVSLVIQYLALNPGEGFIRIRLVDFFSAQSTGMFGMALLTSIALDLSRLPNTLRDASTPDDKELHKEVRAFTVFARNALQWMNENGPILIGRTQLPSALFTLPPDSIVYTVEKLLQDYEPLNSDAEIDIFEKYLAVGTASAYAGSDPFADLNLVWIASMKLAVASRFQKARDYGELLLQLADNTPPRSRVAWRCYGDIYERCGNTIESLVAVACALSADREATAEQVWHESLLLYRLMRNLHINEKAQDFLAAGLDALEAYGVRDRYDQRVETLALQSRLAEIHYSDAELNQTDITSFMDEVLANSNKVMERDDEPEPIAAILAEMLRLSELTGLVETEPGEAVLEQLLGKASPSYLSSLKAIRMVHPSAEQVLAVLNGLELARHNDDLAFDLRKVIVLARRLLAGLAPEYDPIAASFAIDLVTDRGVGASQGAHLLANAMPTSLGQAANTALEISKRSDVSLVMVGLDSDSKLVRMVIDDKLRIPAMESDDIFSARRLEAWSDRFPHAYGTDHESLNLFYTSTEGIGLSEIPDRAILIMSTELQQYPANLLQIDNQLAGFSKRIAVAPSLSWLSTTQQTEKSSDGRLLAWIPTENSALDRDTLKMIANRLGEPFEAFGVELNETVSLPTTFSEAELVVVTAHGGLVPEGRYFQVIQDDASLAIASTQISDALNNVGIVVLFVCSGGRVDKHPLAQTTIGLASLLLNNGCNAVVASPWPLDTSVPPHWLPTFLQALTEGFPVIDAVFEANQHVRSNYSDDPRNCLAMHVYGDPTRKIDILPQSQGGGA